MRGMGFDVYVVKSYDEVDDFIKEMSL